MCCAHSLTRQVCINLVPETCATGCRDRQFTTDTAHGGARRALANKRRSSERHDGTRATFVGRKHVQHASGTRHNRQQRETLRQGEAGVTRRERGLASTSARCAARASQRASEVRPRTVGSPVDVLGPDELARRFMRAHGGAQRDLLRSWRAPRRASPCWLELGRGGCSKLSRTENPAK